MSTFGGARVIALLSMCSQTSRHQIKIIILLERILKPCGSVLYAFIYQEYRLSCHETITGHITGHSTRLKTFINETANSTIYSFNPDFYLFFVTVTFKGFERNVIDDYFIVFFKYIYIPAYVKQLFTCLHIFFKLFNIQDI